MVSATTVENISEINITPLMRNIQTRRDLVNAIDKVIVDKHHPIYYEDYTDAIINTVIDQYQLYLDTRHIRTPEHTLEQQIALKISHMYEEFLFPLLDDVRKAQDGLSLSDFFAKAYRTNPAAKQIIQKRLGIKD